MRNRCVIGRWDGCAKSRHRATVTEETAPLYRIKLSKPTSVNIERLKRLNAFRVALPPETIQPYLDGHRTLQIHAVTGRVDDRGVHCEFRAGKRARNPLAVRGTCSDELVLYVSQQTHRIGGRGLYHLTRNDALPVCDYYLSAPLNNGHRPRCGESCHQIGTHFSQ